MTDSFPLRVYMSPVSDFSVYDQDTVLSQLSSRGRAKALRIKNRLVKNRSLTAEFLLMYALTMAPGFTTDRCRHQENIWGFSEVPELEEEADGKPYLRDHQEIGFSLSHSGDYVLCAVGRGAVGADIQKREPLKTDISARFYTDAERRYMSCCSDALMAFYHVWVLKESYVKYTGKGLAEGLESFSVVPEGMEADGCPMGAGRFTASGGFYAGGAFALDPAHNEGGRLKLSVFDMEEYAVGICHKGSISGAPCMVDICRITADRLKKAK